MQSATFHTLRFYLAPVKEIAIVGSGPQARELVRVVRGEFRPHIVLAGGAGDGVPLLEDREAVDGRRMQGLPLLDQAAGRRPAHSTGR